MIWSLTSMNSSFWQLKEILIHGNRQGLISFLSTKIAAKRNDVALSESDSPFGWWIHVHKKASWKSTNDFQRPEDPILLEQALGKRSTRGQCFSNLSMHMNYLGIWLNAHSDSAGLSSAFLGAAVTADPHRPYFEYQGSRQGAFWTLPLILLQFSSSPKHPSSATITCPSLSLTYCPTSVPHYSLSIFQFS